MLTKMPIIHMKLIESKKKAAKGVYSCPCYVYPDRHGSRDKPSYVMNFDLKVLHPCFHACILPDAAFNSPARTNPNSG
jgi:hypothetical protein